MATAKPRLGAKRGANAGGSPAPRVDSPAGPAATSGERARVCLRIRPALTEEEGQDNTALQCDRMNKLVWALGDTEEGEPETAPRQYAFDEVLEQHVGQAEVFDIVAMQPVQAALSAAIWTRRNPAESQPFLHKSLETVRCAAPQTSFAASPPCARRRRRGALRRSACTGSRRSTFKCSSVRPL